MTLSREERIHHHELLDRMLSGQAVTWWYQSDGSCRERSRRVKLLGIAFSADQYVWLFTPARNGEGMTYRTGADRLHLEDT